MQTILPIPAQGVFSRERGLASNLLRTIARSPSALDGYLEFRRALRSGVLSATAGEQIALAVAQVNLCEYSLAEHAYFAAQLGLTREQIQASRDARATDWRTDAILRFVRDLAARKGQCSLVELRENDCSDAEIIEVLAHVALNVFENYVNDVALTELDFPRLERAVRAA
jgi:AhpD family alkylhydroperoxidase